MNFLIMFTLLVFGQGLAQIEWTSLPKVEGERVKYIIGYDSNRRPATSMRLYTQGAIGDDLLIRLAFFVDGETSYGISCQKVTYLGGTSVAYLLQRKSYGVFGLRKNSSATSYIKDYIEAYKQAQPGSEAWAKAAAILCNSIDVYKTLLDVSLQTTDMSIPRFEGRPTEIYLSDYWNAGLFTIEADLNSTLVNFSFHEW